MKFTRDQRAFVFKVSIATIAVVVFCILVFILKELILPVIVGAILAFLFKPLLNTFKYHWLPESIRIVGLLVFFVGFLFSSIWLVRSAIPSEVKKLELLTRMQYKLNEKVDYFLETKKSKEDRSVFTNLLNEEMSPLINDINNYLALSSAQQKIFVEYYEKNLVKEKYYQFFQENLNHKSFNEAPLREISSNENVSKSFTLSRILNVFSIWIVMPLVFIFLLFDKGDIQRYFVRFIPNRYFELTLTVFEQVDLAIGRYLRGTLVECLLVALTMFIGLFLIGIEFQAAFLIATITGLTNAIPLVGPLVGLVVGFAYAMIAENIYPIIPFMTADDLIIGIIITIIVTQILDNAIFQPIVVGSAVNLHPIVIILGVVGGSSIFGFAGVLLAIPAIVVLKVSLETLFKGLKDYYII